MVNSNNKAMSCANARCRRSGPILSAPRVCERVGLSSDTREVRAARGPQRRHGDGADRKLDGTVNLLKLSGGTGMVGSGGSVCVAGSAAVAVPVTWFQVVNRSAISRWYSLAPSRWRRGRKCGEMPLKADRNRWACPGEVNRFMARSRWRVGWCEWRAEHSVGGSDPGWGLISVGGLCPGAGGPG